MSNVKCFAEMLGTFEGIYSRGTFPYFDNKQRNFAKEVCEEVILHFASKLGLSLGQSWNVFKIMKIGVFHCVALDLCWWSWKIQLEKESESGWSK